MTPEEYAARQAFIAAAATALTYQMAQYWAQAALTPLEWVRLLRFIWPEVQRARYESAVLARQFYDSQRLLYYPELPLFETPLESSDFDVFVQNMEPVRKKMSVADSPKDAVTKMALQVSREVENAGRRQIIHAVKQDQEVAQAVAQQQRVEERKRVIPESSPELVAELKALLKAEPEEYRTSWGGAQVLNLRDSKKQLAEEARSGLVRGWARVATGRETCGWCLMLISRGPVYYSAQSAGLDIDDESAIEMFRESDIETYGTDTRGFMEDWHTGCDCKVIPVFKADDWENSRFGRSAKFALGLWNDASEEAERLMEERGPRDHKTGKNKGEEITFNEEAILALRRRLESGAINPIEYAGLAA